MAEVLKTLLLLSAIIIVNSNHLFSGNKYEHSKWNSKPFEEQREIVFPDHATYSFGHRRRPSSHRSPVANPDRKIFGRKFFTLDHLPIFDGFKEFKSNSKRVGLKNFFLRLRKNWAGRNQNERVQQDSNNYVSLGVPYKNDRVKNYGKVPIATAEKEIDSSFINSQYYQIPHEPLPLESENIAITFPNHETKVRPEYFYRSLAHRHLHTHEITDKSSSTDYNSKNKHISSQTDFQYHHDSPEDYSFLADKDQSDEHGLPYDSDYSSEMNDDKHKSVSNEENQDKYQDADSHHDTSEYSWIRDPVFMAIREKPVTSSSEIKHKLIQSLKHYLISPSKDVNSKKQSSSSIVPDEPTVVISENIDVRLAEPSLNEEGFFLAKVNVKEDTEEYEGSGDILN